MKADEIIKILRGCGNGMNTCVECSYYREKDPHECKFKAMYAAANLIKAQQQEIEQHIKWNEAHTKARVEQAELIDKLVQDKDEQAGRIMRMESGLRRLKRSFQWLSEDMRGKGYKEWAEDKIDAIDALLGGKEDVEKPQT